MKELTYAKIYLCVYMHIYIYTHIYREIHEYINTKHLIFYNKTLLKSGTSYTII